MRKIKKKVPQLSHGQILTTLYQFTTPKKHTQGGKVNRVMHHESPCWHLEVPSTAVRPDRKKKRTSYGSLPPSFCFSACSSLFLTFTQFKGTLLAWLSKINNTARGVYITVLLAASFYVLKFPHPHCRLLLCLRTVFVSHSLIVFCLFHF